MFYFKKNTNLFLVMMAKDIVYFLKNFKCNYYSYYRFSRAWLWKFHHNQPLTSNHLNNFSTVRADEASQHLNFYMYPKTTQYYYVLQFFFSFFLSKDKIIIKGDIKVQIQHPYLAKKRLPSQQLQVMDNKQKIISTMAKPITFKGQAYCSPSLWRQKISRLLLLRLQQNHNGCWRSKPNVDTPKLYINIRNQNRKRLRSTTKSSSEL